MGHVKFKPSKATDLIFAGLPRHRTPDHNPRPPGGTFYVYKKGRLIPVPLSNLFPSTSRKNVIVSKPIKSHNTHTPTRK